MKRRIGSLTSLIIAAALIAVGIMQNQQADVWTKAIKICLECVGIG